MGASDRTTSSKWPEVLTGKELEAMDPRKGLRVAQMFWISGIMISLLATGVGLLVQLAKQSSSAATGAAAATSGSQSLFPLIFAGLTGFLIIEGIVMGFVLPALIRNQARTMWEQRKDDQTALLLIARTYSIAAIIRVVLMVAPAIALLIGLVNGLPAWWAILVLPILFALGFYQPKRSKLEAFIADCSGATVLSSSGSDPARPGLR
jgi:hypothetical protein